MRLQGIRLGGLRRAESIAALLWKNRCWRRQPREGRPQATLPGWLEEVAARVCV